MFSFAKNLRNLNILHLNLARGFSFENINMSQKTKLFFSKDIHLENKKLKMVPLKGSDISALRPILLDKSLWIYNPNFVCSNEEELKNYIDKALEQKASQKRYPLLVLDAADGRCTGTTSFYNASFEHSTIAIGYTVLGKEFHKSHVNQNSKYLLLEYAFEELGMQRVEFFLETLNQNSVVSLLKMGIKHEGILRSNILTRTGRRRDTTVMSLLSDEWPKVKEKFKKKL